MIINQQAQRSRPTWRGVASPTRPSPLVGGSHHSQESTPSSRKCRRPNSDDAARDAPILDREEEGFIAPRLSLAANNNIIMEAIKRPRTSARGRSHVQRICIHALEIARRHPFDVVSTLAGPFPVDHGPHQYFLRPQREARRQNPSESRKFMRHTFDPINWETNAAVFRGLHRSGQ